MVAADTRTQARHRGCPGGGDLEVRDGTAASGFTLLVTKSHFQEFLVSLYNLVQKKRWKGRMSSSLIWSQSPAPLIPRSFRLWRKAKRSLGADHLG